MRGSQLGHAMRLVRDPMHRLHQAWRPMPRGYVHGRGRRRSLLRDVRRMLRSKRDLPARFHRHAVRRNGRRLRGLHDADDAVHLRCQRHASRVRKPRDRVPRGRLPRLPHGAGPAAGPWDDERLLDDRRRRALRGRPEHGRLQRLLHRAPKFRLRGLPRAIRLRLCDAKLEFAIARRRTLRHRAVTPSLAWKTASQETCDTCVDSTACNALVETGLCEAEYAQALGCLTQAETGPAAFCDPTVYANFGAWLASVGARVLRRVRSPGSADAWRSSAQHVTPLNGYSIKGGRSGGP